MPCSGAKRFFFFLNLRTQVFHKWGYPNGHKSHETVPTSIPHPRNTHKTRARYPRHTYRNPRSPVLGRLEEAQNSAAPRETVWQFLIELKTHHAAQQTPSWILTKRNKSAYLHTHTNYIRNYSQLWSYCEKLETTQMSISWWANKLLSEMEKQGTDETPATWRNLGDTALGVESRLRKTPCLQWLRLHAPSAEGTGSIPGQGTKIPRAAQWGQKRKRQKKKTRYYMIRFIWHSGKGKTIGA